MRTASPTTGEDEPPAESTSSQARTATSTSSPKTASRSLAESKVRRGECGMSRAARLESRAVFVGRGARHALIMSWGLTPGLTPV